jgi:hypothetical protein
VLKKALCMSASSVEEHLKQVDQCTKAVAFLGTPHCGSNLALFATSVGNILKAGGKRVNVDILRILEPNSQLLGNAEDSFGVWLRNKSSFNITCFFKELELLSIG